MGNNGFITATQSIKVDITQLRSSLQHYNDFKKYIKKNISHKNSNKQNKKVISNVVYPPLMISPETLVCVCVIPL